MTCPTACSHREVIIYKCKFSCDFFDRNSISACNLPRNFHNNILINHIGILIRSPIQSGCAASRSYFNMLRSIHGPYQTLLNNKTFTCLFKCRCTFEATIKWNEEAMTAGLRQLFCSFIKFFIKFSFILLSFSVKKSLTN